MGRSARIGALVDRVRRCAEPWFWQLLLEPGDAHARRFSKIALVETHADRGEQKGRLIDLALGTIGADDGDAERAFDVLASFDHLGDAVKPAQIDGIAALLRRLPTNDTHSARLFDLLLGTGRADAPSAPTRPPPHRRGGDPVARRGDRGFEAAGRGARRSTPASASRRSNRPPERAPPPIN